MTLAIPIFCRENPKTSDCWSSSTCTLILEVRLLLVQKNSPAGWCTGMYDIHSFSLDDMATLGGELRHMGEGMTGLDSTARGIVNHLYQSFVMSGTSEPAFVLVRLFVTHRMGELDPSVQAYVSDRAAEVELARPVVKDTRCLTLLATAGDLPEWNDVRKSRHHRAIPISSPDLPDKFPMIARVLQQFGVEFGTIMTEEEQDGDGIESGDSGDLVVDREQSTFNVFYVPEAKGSPYINAQEEFVIPHKIKSVLGYGGVLSAGQIFAVILFSRAFIGKDMAHRFKPLALSTKNALIQVAASKVSSPVESTSGN